MAELEKFSTADIAEICGHNARTHATHRNTDINADRTYLNYSFQMKHQGFSDFDFFKKRVSELYLYGRGSKREKDAVTGVSWVVTAPNEIVGNHEEEGKFFKAVYSFVSHRYGSRNIISNAVHYDEAGSPHIHILFIPVTDIDHDQVHYRTIRTNQVVRKESGRYEFGFRYRYDSEGNEIPTKNYSKQSDLYTEKISANDVINKIELQHFHDDLQTYLDDHHIRGRVKNGATGGFNIPVRDLKKFTKETGLHLSDVQGIDTQKTLLTNFVEQQSKIADMEKAITQSNEKIADLQEKKKENTHSSWSAKGWGKTSGWNTSEEEKTW